MRDGQIDRPEIIRRRPTVYRAADAHLFTVLNWGQCTGTDLAKWPVLKDYATRIASRPQVREALKAEGLLKVPEGGVAREWKFLLPMPPSGGTGYRVQLRDFSRPAGR